MRAGAAGAGSDSGHAVGLLGGQEERELPVTLPEVVEDEEQEDDTDPYSTWHALYGTEALMNSASASPQSITVERGHEPGDLLCVSVITIYLHVI